MKDLETLVRPNIWRLKPYSSARDEFKGEASVFLDANENPYNAPYNRYPDPLQWQLKEKIAVLKGVNINSIFLGVGSDEPIDLLYRAFCEPAIDNALAIDPTYGMYKVCADINNVEYRTVRLNDNFDFDPDNLLSKADSNSKLLFLCSPNNPSGNSFAAEKIEYILKNFQGIVIVDEAYIDFSATPTLLKKLDQYPNLVVLQTFSKAWGSAGIRIYPSDANFLLTKTCNAQALYDYLVGRGIIVRNRNKITLCENCLRITVGTPDENRILVDALKEIKL